MKCQFCNKGKGEISITDGETLKELLICESCNELMYWKIPKAVKKIKGYQELTIQELEKKIDDVIDNQIEDLKIQTRN